MNSTWNTTSFQLFGSKGHKQHGIDVYSSELGLAVQCKKKDITRKASILRKELKNELIAEAEKVDAAGLDIKTFILASTFTNHPELIQQAEEIAADLPFQVRYLGWPEIENAINHFDDLRKQYYDQLIDHFITPPPALPPIYLGRNEDLEELNKKVQGGRITVLTGEGGMGKSALAAALVNHSHSEYRHIFWLHNRGSLIESVLSSAEESTLNFQMDPNKTLKDNFNDLMQTLVQIPGPNLLVIDNAESPEEVLQICPSLPLSSWKALFCTRTKPPGLPWVRITELKADHAKDLFYAHFTRDKDDAALEELLRMVGYHTLTIELLAKTLSTRRRFSISSLRDEIRGKVITDISLESPVNTWHNNNEEKVEIGSYLVKILEVINLSKYEKDVLLRMAILPPSEFDFEEITGIFQIRPIHEQAFEDSLNELINLGWINESAAGLQMHALISEVVLAQLLPNDDLLEGYLDFILDRINYDNLELSPIHVRQWLPFANKLFKFLPLDSPTIANICNYSAMVYKDLHELDTAFQLMERVQSSIESTFPEGHPFLGHLYSNHASIFFKAGKRQNAQAYFQKSKEMHERFENRSLFDQSTTLNNEGKILLEEGKFDEGIVKLEQSLAIRREVLGDEHSRTAQSMENLGQGYRRVKRYQDSIQIHQKAIDIRKRILRPNDPKIAQSHTGLACTYLDMKDYENALKHQREALKIIQESYPENHPDTATAYHNLAGILFESEGTSFENVPLAKEYQEKAVAIERVVHAPMHYDRALPLHRLGSIQMFLRDFEAAKRSYDECLEIFNYNFPDGHPYLVQIEREFALLNIFINKPS